LWGWLCAVIVSAITVLMVWLAWHSDLLRDSGPAPTALGPNKKQIQVRKPYSLARTQLALWFWAVIVSYITIWLMNCETGTLTGQVLGILGISTLTLVGSVAMDSRNQEKEQATLLEASKSIIEKEQKVAEIEAKKSSTADAQTKAAMSVVQQHLKNATADLKEQTEASQELCDTPREYESFLKDILSDDYGVSFHRFQVFAWTLVLIVIFLEHVWRNLAMPQLNEYLLTLMGMSAGTFVGLKATETKPAPKPQASLDILPTAKT
jgi:hypothetical protein